MIRAFAVLIVSLFTLAVFFGAVAPGIAPVFDAVKTNDAVQGSSVVGPEIITELETVTFVFVPLIFGAGAVLLAFLYAIRLRGTSGARP